MDAAAERMFVYFRDLLRQRRADPRDLSYVLISMRDETMLGPMTSWSTWSP